MLKISDMDGTTYINERLVAVVKAPQMSCRNPDTNCYDRIYPKFWLVFYVVGGTAQCHSFTREEDADRVFGQLLDQIKASG